MTKGTFIKQGNLFRSSGLGALAAALAMMVIPADAMAQNRGDRTREWQKSQKSETKSAPRRSSSSRDQSSARQRSEAPRIERTATRTENRGDRKAARIDSRSETRASQIRDRGDRRAQRAARNGNEERASRVERRSTRAARQTERQGDWRSNRVDRRSERRADNIRSSTQEPVRTETRRERTRSTYNKGDRVRDWQRDRSYRSDRRSDYSRDYRRWDSKKWRKSNRYDWHHHRARHRSTYRLGRYYAPYRHYSYRRISLGYTLSSLFFSSRYWINDPWQYRLPAVYGPYRWVRYYDDVLLVNVYSGEVVDVIRNFFW